MISEVVSSSKETSVVSVDSAVMHVSKASQTSITIMIPVLLVGKRVFTMGMLELIFLNHLILSEFICLYPKE